MVENGLNSFKIGDLANLLGMSTRTIRYYEEIGLLTSIERIEGGKRVYTENDLQRLKFIKRLKHLGLTLSEMHELEDLYQFHRTNSRVLPRLLELLDNHVQKIDERMSNLIKLKADILIYQEKIRQKVSVEGDFKKGENSDERSSDYQRRPYSHR